MKYIQAADERNRRVVCLPLSNKSVPKSLRHQSRLDYLPTYLT